MNSLSYKVYFLYILMYSNNKKLNLNLLNLNLNLYEYFNR